VRSLLQICIDWKFATEEAIRCNVNAFCSLDSASARVFLTNCQSAAYGLEFPKSCSLMMTPKSARVYLALLRRRQSGVLGCSCTASSPSEYPFGCRSGYLGMQTSFAPSVRWMSSSTTCIGCIYAIWFREHQASTIPQTRPRSSITHAPVSPPTPTGPRVSYLNLRFAGHILQPPATVHDLE
jgi:hypothetical protein